MINTDNNQAQTIKELEYKLKTLEEKLYQIEDVVKPINEQLPEDKVLREIMLIINGCNKENNKCKPIVINGVDVRKCVYRLYDCKWQNHYCRAAYWGNTKSEFCCENKNCYYKQYARFKNSLSNSILIGAMTKISNIINKVKEEE